MLTARSEEDQLLLDEGNFTLSEQIGFLSNKAHRSCSQVMYLYNSMDFNKLIKPNPFEFNWKEPVVIQKPFEKPLEEFNSKLDAEANRGVSSLTEIKTKVQAEINQMGSSNLGDLLTKTASQGQTRDFEEEKPENINKKVSNKQKSEDKRKESHSLKEIREKEVKERIVMMNSTEKATKTFPHGILKIGDKSRFSRSFEEKSKSFTRGYSDSFSKSHANSASLKNQNNPSVFAKWK